MKTISLALAGIAAILLVASANGQSEPEPQVITFSINNTTTRSAYVFKPSGNGPFSVVIWLHAQSRPLLQAGPASQYFGIAKAYLSSDYMVVVPDRRNTSVGLDEFSPQLRAMIKTNANDPGTAMRKYMELIEINAGDAMAAVDWVCKQPYANTNRLVLSGWGYGGALALVAAARDPRITACVPFSPAIKVWDENSLVQALLRKAVRNAKAPILLIQTENDKTVAPAAVLGKELEKKSGPNRVKIYPPYGKSHLQQESLSTAGWEIWGYDVVSFLDDVWKK